MQKKVLKEFIDGDGNIPDSKIPPGLNAKSTSHITSDKMMRMVAQPFVFVNYRRYYGESELPYNEEADKHAKDPKKFYEFLKTKGAEATFEEYFTKDEKSLQETLKDIRKQKAIDLIEDILTKRQIYNDVFAKQAENTKSIDEIKNDNKLIFGQLDKILEFIKYNMDTGEKHLILSHIMENLK